MTQGKTHREPLLRIAKRDGLVWWKAWLIRIAAVAAALLVMRNTHQGNHAAQHHADRQSNCCYIQRGDDPFEVLLPAV